MTDKFEKMTKLISDDLKPQVMLTKDNKAIRTNAELPKNTVAGSSVPVKVY